METKVSKNWFKEHGFVESVYENVRDYKNHMQEVTKEKQTSYSIYFKDRWVRFDIYYNVTTNRFGDKKISRYYMLYACNQKTRYTVENRITHYLPTVEQLKAACLICGIAI